MPDLIVMLSIKHLKHIQQLDLVSALANFSSDHVFLTDKNNSVKDEKFTIIYYFCLKKSLQNLLYAPSASLANRRLQ